MKIAILAGEASGDVLGADLMKGLPADYVGIGGAHMQAAGLESLFPMEELSVMGIAEVLPRLPRLLKRIKEAANYVIESGAEALITVDSPDFSHRVAKRVKKARPDLPVIHYVAPSVWAWRAGRARKMAGHVDHVLCLLPFEPPLMEAAGMSADFVGHPVSKISAPKGVEAWRKKHGDVLALYPGSRRSELKHNLPIYKQAFENIGFNGKIIIPTLPHLEESIRQAFPEAEILSQNTLGLEGFEAEKLALMYGAKLAIATSGTVSFELAWAGCSSIVCYQTTWLNRFLARRLLKVKWASLANILLNREAIPELIFENFTADNLAKRANSALASDDFAQMQRADFKKMRTLMTPKLDAAQSVKAFLSRQ